MVRQVKDGTLETASFSRETMILQWVRSLLMMNYPVHFLCVNLEGKVIKPGSVDFDGREFWPDIQAVSGVLSSLRLPEFSGVVVEANELESSGVEELRAKVEAIYISTRRADVEFWVLTEAHNLARVSSLFYEWGFLPDQWWKILVDRSVNRASV